MSKSKKTRQQKIIADLRRKVSMQPSLPQKEHYVLPSSKVVAVHTPFAQLPTKQHVISYAFLLSDLKKTLAVTAAIIGAELILFLLLTKHILNIPFVVY